MYGKGVLEALIQRYCLPGIPSMFYINLVNYENDMLSLCETTNVFIDAFFVISKFHFHQLGSKN